MSDDDITQPSVPAIAKPPSPAPTAADVVDAAGQKLVGEYGTTCGKCRATIVVDIQELIATKKYACSSCGARYEVEIDIQPVALGKPPQRST